MWSSTYAARSIEVGQVFQLGTKYSCFNATTDENDEDKPLLLWAATVLVFPDCLRPLGWAIIDEKGIMGQSLFSLWGFCSALWQRSRDLGCMGCSWCLCCCWSWDCCWLIVQMSKGFRWRRSYWLPWQVISRICCNGICRSQQQSTGGALWGCPWWSVLVIEKILSRARALKYIKLIRKTVEKIELWFVIVFRTTFGNSSVGWSAWLVVMRSGFDPHSPPRILAAASVAASFLTGSQIGYAGTYNFG